MRGARIDQKRIIRSSTSGLLLFAMTFLVWSAAPLRAQTNSFGGVVIGLDGNPLPGVTVTAKPEGANAAGLPTSTTQTDASGRYRFEAVPSGIYLVTTGTEDGKGTSLRTQLVTSIESAIFLTSTGAVAGVSDRMKVSPILMGPGRITLPDDTISSVDLIVLPSVVLLSGRMDIPTGVTLPPVRVSLTRTPPQTEADLDIQPTGAPPLPPTSPAARAFRINALSEFTRDADIQPDGTFQLSQIPPGMYVLRLIPNLGVPTVSITVADQNLTGVTLGGKSVGVRISGYTARSDQQSFKDRFPEWVYLIAQDAAELQGSTVTSRVVPARSYMDAAGVVFEAPITPVHADGRFDFLAVPAGEYYLRTIPEAGIPDSKITVADKDIDNIRVGDGARVRGEVIATNSGTRPPEVISLLSTKPRGQSVTALVDANGSFEFPKIGAGIYRILLDGKVRPSPSETTVGNEDVIIRVETPFSAWVPGRVTFDGPSPPSESLEATRVALTNGYVAAIKPDGSFQIKSDEGEFAFSMFSLPEGYVVKSVVSSGANLLVEPVKVDLRIPTPEILVTLQYKPEATQ